MGGREKPFISEKAAKAKIYEVEDSSFEDFEQEYVELQGLFRATEALIAKREKKEPVPEHEDISLNLRELVSKSHLLKERVQVAIQKSGIDKKADEALKSRSGLDHVEHKPLSLFYNIEQLQAGLVSLANRFHALPD